MLCWHDISFLPRTKLQSVADVLRGSSTRDEPPRTSAWEAREVLKEACSQVLSPTLSRDGKERTLGTGLVPWGGKKR